MYMRPIIARFDQLVDHGSKNVHPNSKKKDLLHPPGVEPEPFATLLDGRQISYRWTIDAVFFFTEYIGCG